MMLAPPPPTQFRELTGPVAERITTLWRIATTDEQRWEIERLAVEIMAMPEPAPRDDAVVATFTRAEWQDLERDASDAASRAAAEAVADVLRDWLDEK